MKKRKLVSGGIFSYSEMGFTNKMVASAVVKDGWIYLGLMGVKNNEEA